MKLNDKVAIVAGGGQGIGEGCVRCLAEEGANVAVVDVNGDTAREITERVTRMGRKALAVAADLTDDDQVSRAVAEAVGFFGRIDILVNNVGGRALSREAIARIRQEHAASSDVPLPDFTVFGAEVWDGYYRLNLKSHVTMSHAVTPQFIRQKGGRIVNISSAAGRSADPGHMPYAAMKAGDISITWSLARALAPHNVTVNCICPGFVYTPLWATSATALLEQARAAQARGEAAGRRFAAEDVETLTPYEFWLKYVVVPGTPLGREQTIEDMGRAVVFFASDDARNVTGQVLHVDGGMIMR